MDLQILFEDHDIIVCVKNIGILSQFDENKPNMIELLERYSNTQIFPIHRLDKDVGGVMVYAKNKKTASFLSSQMSNGDFEKEYICLIHSKPSKNEGEMHDFLFKDSLKNKSFVVKRERKGVKKASLKYEVLKTFLIDNLEYSIVKIKLITGRTHQIRVQFASRKLFLTGDKKYGSRDNFKSIGLWSYSLSFYHIKTNERLKFKINPQNYISDYLKKGCF